MFKRIIYKSIKNRKNKILAAVLAIVMGASMVSTLLNISFDLNSKVAKELRSFGANVVIFPGQDGAQALLVDEVKKLSGENMSEYIYGYTPYIYDIGKLRDQKVVIVGTQFEKVKRISPWWKVDGKWNDDGVGEDSIMLGNNVASKLGYKIGDEVVLNIRKGTIQAEINNAKEPQEKMDDAVASLQDIDEENIDIVSSASQYSEGNKTKRWPLNILSEIDQVEYMQKKFKVTGIITTGSSEDSQVFINLSEAQRLFQRESQVDLVQVSILTNKKTVEDISVEIEKLIPGAKTRILSQISKAEGNIQDKIQFLMVLVTILTLIASGLSVMSTMTTAVLERRKEVGVMKAIGAQNKKVAKILYTEAGAIGLLGGILGYILGFLMAQAVGKSVFDTLISFNIAVIPITLISAILLSLISSKIPVGKAIKIDPAVTLRGE